MELSRRLLAAVLLVAVSVTGVACSAQGEIGEDGINAEIEGEGDGEGGDG